MTWAFFHWNLKRPLSYLKSAVNFWNLKKKTIITIEISTLEFFKLKKFVQNKKSQIWSQNVLTGYFMKCNFEKLFSYLKSATWNLSNCKVSCKTKRLRIRDQKRLLWVLLRWDLSRLLSYLKSAPRIWQNTKSCAK